MPIISVEDAKQLQQALDHSTSERVLFVFGTPWCGGCKLLNPMMSRLNEDHNLPIYKVNVDKCSEAKALIEGIRTIPVVAAVDGGKIVGMPMVGKGEVTMPKLRNLFVQLGDASARQS